MLWVVMKMETRQTCKEIGELTIMHRKRGLYNSSKIATKEPMVLEAVEVTVHIYNGVRTSCVVDPTGV